MVVTWWIVAFMGSDSGYTRGSRVDTYIIADFRFSFDGVFIRTQDSTVNVMDELLLRRIVYTLKCLWIKNMLFSF